jgi:hypothetical protein
MRHPELRGCGSFKSGNRLAKNKLLRLKNVPQSCNEFGLKARILPLEVKHRNRQ